MLSRRLVLAGPALAALSRTAAAQDVQDAGTDLVLLAPDSDPGSVKTATGLAARLGGPDVRLRARASRGIIDAAARLADRPDAVSAMLPSVALGYMIRSGLPPSSVYALRFIARLGIDELHVLAAQRIGRLADLAGQKVALGPQGSTTHTTAMVLLDRLPLRVDPVYLEHDQALAGVLRGEIAAMMLVAPAPVPLLLQVNLSDKLHVLAVDEIGGLPAGLLPALILPEDYPQLGGGEAGRGRAVATLGVPMVLGCFNWSSATPMFAGLARLCDLLAEHGSGLRGFDMAAGVAGWERFPPVADWLARGRGGTIQDAAFGRRRAAPATPAGTEAGGAASAPANAAAAAEQKERLFQQFLKWQRGQ
jgi:hypothetical protein